MKNLVSEFEKELKVNPSLQEDFKKDPMGTIKKFESTSPVFYKDLWVYRIVVSVLGLVILAVIIGVIGIMATSTENVDSKVPTILAATCSTAIGALTGLLAPSPTSAS